MGDANYRTSNFHRGTRCGKTTSVEVDITNTSPSNMRGYVFFQKLDGTWAWGDPTGMLKPGEKVTKYICEGTGNFEYRYNIGPEPKYPPRDY